MAKRFHYFELNGIGEGIRYLLHYGGVKFEDVRYNYNDWPKQKATLPYGQLPVYEEAGHGTINQSLAIARYLGQTLSLMAGDRWQDAQLDALVLTVYDFWTKIVEYIKAEDEDHKKELKKVLLTETIDFFFSRFEKQLKENKGFFGGKLTWADFVFVGIVEAANLFLDTKVESKYPTVQALITKIHAYPGVKSYVSTRKPYTNPLAK